MEAAAALMLSKIEIENPEKTSLIYMLIGLAAKFSLKKHESTLCDLKQDIEPLWVWYTSLVIVVNTKALLKAVQDKNSSA